ncbi:hypothetical protein V1389_01675 [Flavobacterium rakeshii]|uniref:hypothetical protein n=1 Tax=Flavobacterium rakeshii TaxID=1038845 RepID=UPI002E7C3875|nr:hypothetical protein [Flavobacterium rakeshii]MEE1897026.1 hypothetical protein [Flavobacterium rakeshii]
MKFKEFKSLVYRLRFLPLATALAIVTGLSGCGQKKTTPDEGNAIYSDGKEWTYNVTFSDSSGTALSNCTLKLSVGSSSVASVFTGQKGITYNYTNCDSNQSFEETTGVDESTEGIFLHPPRLGAFAFTEVVPFPRINYPPELITSSEVELTVRKSAFKPAENKTFQHTIERTVTDTLTFKNSKVVCYVVEGRNTNYIKEIGQYKGKYWFSPKYGFVQLLYYKPDGSTVDLLLADTNF